MIKIAEALAGLAILLTSVAAIILILAMENAMEELWWVPAILAASTAIAFITVIADCASELSHRLQRKGEK